MNYLILIFLLTCDLAFATCDWCLGGNQKILEASQNFLSLSPKEQIEKIEKEGIKIFILNSDKPINVPFFQWKIIRIDQGKLTDISKLEGSLGKTLCKNERPIAKDGITIVLNSDAPLSTLLHEYLHVLQIKNDSTWCTLSKGLWENSTPKINDIEVVRNHEWDVRKILWKLKDHKSFNVEDKIIITEGFIKEAELRKGFDKNSLKFIKDEKAQEYLLKIIDEYKNELLRINKK